MNRNTVCSGRPRSGRSEENIQNVQELFVNNLRGVSCRRNGLGISASMFHRIVKKDRNWQPHKIRVRHELKPGDLARRIRFAEKLIEKCGDNRFLSNLLISDEAGLL